MVLKIYILIFSYFNLGLLLGAIITRKSNADFKKEFWLKFWFYFIIINLVFASIVFNPVYFHYLSVFIIVAGYIELGKVFISSDYKLRRFFIISIIFYSLISTGFYFFGRLKMELVLFTFIVLSAFDAFSQISGQLFGKKKLMPKISPKKTVEGLIGGIICTLITAILLKELIDTDFKISFFYGIIVIITAFAGDLSASIYKRKYGVKDFNKVLPGQGGFLDRFDSLIFSGSFIYFFNFLVE